MINPDEAYEVTHERPGPGRGGRLDVRARAERGRVALPAFPVKSCSIPLRFLDDDRSIQIAGELGFYRKKSRESAWISMALTTGCVLTASPTRYPATTPSSEIRS
jgi:hypothetical protein